MMIRKYRMKGSMVLLALASMVFCFTDSRALHAQTVTATSISPQAASEIPPAAELSPAQRESMHLRLLELRERYSAQVDNGGKDSGGLESVAGRESNVDSDAAEFHSPISSMVIGRNNKNTRANAVGSTLAEPAAANEGREVFYTGNEHAEYSSDGGLTWTNVPIGAGPADASIPCCDQDVIYDQARGTIFWSNLYTNAAQTNGVIRIGVIRNTPNGGVSCFYTIDPAGTANNLLPDYPHLGITNGFLFITANLINTAGSWVGSQMRRYNIDSMADCLTAAGSVYTYTAASQRVFVPAEGTRDAMYWGAVLSSTVFRIFRWPDNSGAVSAFDRAISASNFVNPDCRGGTGNFDWIERSTAWSIAGFRLRCAMGWGSLESNRLSCYWNVGPDGAASHNQGHVHAAVFGGSGLALLAQPHIFNSGFCFGFPAVSANERGDLGMSIAYGGKAGGAGTAAQAGVGVDDDFTAGLGFFGTFTTTATGTHNRTDSRFGDYFTVRNQEPCDMWFAATNYALSGGVATANVNARYVEFGRGQTRKCYTRWNNLAATP